MKFVLFLCLFLFSFTQAGAHQPSSTYLRINTKDSEFSGQWAIALRDLEISAGIDSNFDGKITWGELKQNAPNIEKYLQRNLTLKANNQPCAYKFNKIMVDKYDDGKYSVLFFTGECHGTIDKLDVEYQFLFNIDAQHKGMLLVTSGSHTATSMFSTDRRKTSLPITSPGYGQEFKDFVHQGMWHIWLGLDHFLFLIALLLPAALVYRKGKWEANNSFKNSFNEVFKFISAFTIAHAISLTLAVFNLVHVPTRLVESLIALSIIISALNNIHPFLQRRLWGLTFCFGLIHGLGFANILQELGLTNISRIIALFGFNIGVEIGQLAVVFVLLPIFFTMRNHKFYRIVIVHAGSWIIVALASIWFAQRAFKIILIKGLK